MSEGMVQAAGASPALAAERSARTAESDDASAFQAVLESAESELDAEAAPATPGTAFASLGELLDRMQIELRRTLEALFGARSAALGNFDSVRPWLNRSDVSTRQTFQDLIDALLRREPAMAEDALAGFAGLRMDAEAIAGYARGGGEEPSGRMTGLRAAVSFEAMKVEVSAEVAVARAEAASGEGEGGAVSTLRIQSRSVFMEAMITFCDPLVLDMAGDGFDLRGVEEGVDFDISGDGMEDRTAFVRGDDALLFLDENENGMLDDGGELFGDQDGDANGFAKLAKYDGNGDGVIDARDAVYHRLRLFQDRDGDGVSSEEEIRTLADAGILTLGLAADAVDRVDAHGNRFTHAGQFWREDGSVGDAADALFRCLRGDRPPGVA